MSTKTKKVTTRSTNSQIRVLVDYMSANRNFANGEYTGPMGQRTHMEEWVHLKSLLKNYGPDKSVEQWRHTWRDIKKRAREEGAKVRRARGMTGNLPVPELSEQHNKVLEIIGKEMAVGIGLEETGIGEVSLPSRNTGQIPTFPDPAPTSPFTISEKVLTSPYVAASSSSPTVHSLASAPTNFAPSSLLSPVMNVPDTPLCFYPESNVPVPPTSSSPTINAPVQSPSPQHPPPNWVPTPFSNISAPVKPPTTTATVTSARPTATVAASDLPRPQANRPRPSQRPQQRRSISKAADFLKAEKETTNVLREISNQLLESNKLQQENNKIAAIESRRRLMKRLHATRPIFKFLNFNNR